jgi:hypothetical protein
MPVFPQLVRMGNVCTPMRSLPLTVTATPAVRIHTPARIALANKPHPPNLLKFPPIATSPVIIARFADIKLSRR